ncbi:carboxyl transferase domain-containing protein [Bradyrhizobium liaoningense]|uniref:carboxyl transferase domain-containing protein n=1 Tax=Bradyrhizobium liaoningense TaxID=43992 RepID=UPI001BA64CCA|nr:carboxyl transferase domain-containing protein [Bradyrhizobium liaoningense]MBR0857724.1 ATP-grasp domain-containing protein [Bradyrhizobium liaoningense]
MSFRKMLIANRGEIALRIARAAFELEIPTVAVFPADDAESAHARAATEMRQLPGLGAAAYLDIEAIVEAARLTACDVVHPGYGFLSENAQFARAVNAAAMTFIGPAAETLELFGNKSEARRLAHSVEVPVLDGSTGPVSQDEAAAFLEKLGGGSAIMLKAIAGGGGRGMRVVSARTELATAWERCRSEAQAAFGADALYVERYMPNARHIEVQIVGDGRAVIHLGERECTIQRRHQKLIESAPSRSLTPEMRGALCNAAIRMADKAAYRGVGTFEFLMSAKGDEFVFIEANPRLQVEHTVTEEVYGIDLVKTQIRVASGMPLDEIGLSNTPVARGGAIQFRVNMESMAADGSMRPTGGVLTDFTLPSGPGIRVDTFGYVGYRTSPRYDSLLAKVIAYSPEGMDDAIRRGRRALEEFRIGGLPTNIPLLRAVVDNEEFRADRISTGFLEQHLEDLVATATDLESRDARSSGRSRDIRDVDPLDVFNTKAFATVAPAARRDARAGPAPEGLVTVPAPLQGTIVACSVTRGDRVHVGQQTITIESMKMEHIVAAPVAGLVEDILVRPGDTIFEGEALLHIAPSDDAGAGVEMAQTVDLDTIRGDLAETMARHAELLDESRPDAVARRRKTNQRTARENIADLCDPDSFIEYGGLALAAQRQRRPLEELRRMSPADGLITGVGSVNGALFGDEQSRCAIMAYDYTVFAGTQGVVNHKKKDRLLTLADRWSLPVVLFAEGGGGRPGDEWPSPAGLETTTFTKFGAVNGKVPLVGMVSGRCFAGNAALLGSCDVIIADRTSNIGMGGPAMIEGGGLGVYRPEDIGPVEVQAPNGVIDVLVENEAEGVAAAKRYLSYFQGRVHDWSAADQRLLRHAVPENRLRAYDVRPIIETLADAKSVLELRPAFAKGMITALARIEGMPVGLIANNSRHLGGAIDADGGDKAARFIQLCDAFGIPIVSLCDTPGMMVGPEVEKTAQVRHVSRMFVAASRATVPYFTIVLRKAYGLGALAMAGGSSQMSFFMVAWPSAEFGAMGLEGAVKLAYRKELAAIEDAAARKAWFDEMVAKSYEENKALSGATFLEVDDVIDPRETRRWIVRGLKATTQPSRFSERRATRADLW